MRTVVRVSDLIFYGSYEKIRSTTVDLFQYKNDDIVWSYKDDSKISQQKIQSYFKIKVDRTIQQIKIITLLNNGINIIPSNILVPFLYKKFKAVDSLNRLLTSKIMQNITMLNDAQNICNSFPVIFNNKIHYDFFRSITGRASSNIGIIKKQQRCKIPHKHNLVQFDFTAFQPTLYQDYFLDKKQIKDAYLDCQGQTREQKKLNWFKNVFSDKQQIRFTNVFNRYMQGTLVYHLQALQTDCMSRLILQLDKLFKNIQGHILMFLFDGLIFDAKLQDVQNILKKIDWNIIFPKSNITEYPYKLSKISD